MTVTLALLLLAVYLWVLRRVLHFKHAMPLTDQQSIDRTERAKQILAARPITEHQDGTFSVPSSKGDRAYTVNLKKKTCSCPDAFYRRTFCKHLRAVQYLLESRTEKKAAGSVGKVPAAGRA